MAGSRVRMTAGHAAERLRKRIAGHDWSAIASGLAVTASFGVAASSGGESSAVVLAVADRRLYAAKDAGRNRVIARDDPAARRAAG